MDDQLEFLLSMQKQKFKRKIIKLGSQYPIGKKQDGEQNIFIRELPLASGSVGAGLWEGGEMMARWIYDNRTIIEQKFQNSLELGSGVGGTGFVMASIIPTILSDYKTNLLKNICYNMWTNIEVEGKEDFFQTKHAMDNFVTTAKSLTSNLALAYLDWFQPTNQTPPEDEKEYLRLLPPHIQKLELLNLTGKKFQLLYGSELNYCLETVDALADAIDIYLEKNGVFWEIISVYRGTGPLCFMQLMRDRDYVVECRELPDNYYIGIESCQRKRDEKYMLWTLYRKGEQCPMAFGDGPIVNWEQLDYKLTQ